MPSTYNNRILYSNPSAGQCNWDVDVERNNRINASIIPPGLDGNYVLSGGVTSVGAGLSVDVTDAEVVVGGVTSKVIGSNYILQPAAVDPFEVNFVWVDVNGTVQVTQEEPDETMVMLSIIDTDTTSVLRVIDGRQMQAAGATVSTAARKNVIINGNFDVWQRGESFDPVDIGDFTADRWMYVQGGSTVGCLALKSTDVPTLAESGMQSASSLLVRCTAANASNTDVVNLRYRTEGYDYQHLAGKVVTFSFWVKATKTGTYCLNVKSSTADTVYVAEYEVESSNWEKKVISIPMTDVNGTWNYDNLVGLQINWMIDGGDTAPATSTDAWLLGDYSNSTNQVHGMDTIGNEFSLSQVQLEIGGTDTDFEYTNYGQQIALCQRYFINASCQQYLTNIHEGTSAVKYTFVNFPCEMRDVPTVTAVLTGGFTPVLPDEYLLGFNVGVSNATAASSPALTAYIADSELK